MGHASPLISCILAYYICICICIYIYVYIYVYIYIYRLHFSRNILDCLLCERISHGWQGLLRLYDAAAPHKHRAQFARVATSEIGFNISPHATVL